MCARYSLTDPPAHPWLCDAAGDLLKPRYNVAPGQNVPIVGRDRDRRLQVKAARWGFRPRWLATGRRAPVNARAETARTTPMFSRAFRAGRCLVPADGWYEWQELESGPRQPWYVYRADHAPFTFAGLATCDSDNELRVAVITTSSAPAIGHIHGRMPAVLADGEAELRWLDPATSDATLGTLLDAITKVACHRVSWRVNRPEHDAPAMVAPIDAGSADG